MELGRWKGIVEREREREGERERDRERERYNNLDENEREKWHSGSYVEVKSMPDTVITDVVLTGADSLDICFTKEREESKR